MVACHCLLVVDDEPEIAHHLQELLHLDYRVLGARRAADALNILEREPVQIVMTDQQMPEMTGVEFFHRLRESHPDVVRLLFTHFADVQAVMDAVNQGAVFRYLRKPWEPRELQGVLRQAAERWDMVAERRRLTDALNENNRKLAALDRQLQEANELKHSFIKVASHELRTPLTILLGLSELAHEHAIEDEAVRQWVDMIYQGSSRLHRTVDEIGQMLLAEKCDGRLTRADVALEALMRQAAAEVAPFVARRQQTLIINAAPDLGSFDVDGPKLCDSLVHLLLNAVKFTPDGGTIRLAGRRLPSDSVELRVEDNGVGIDPASLQHIFDPFFTDFDVSHHTSGVFEFGRHGLGLGLTLVKAFVEMHGGTVDVHSVKGNGATFVITLPASSAS